MPISKFIFVPSHINLINPPEDIKIATIATLNIATVVLKRKNITMKSNSSLEDPRYGATISTHPMNSRKGAVGARREVGLE